MNDHTPRRIEKNSEMLFHVTRRFPSRKGTRTEIKKDTLTNRTQYLYSSSFPQHLTRYKLFSFVFCAFPVQSALLVAKQGSFPASSNRVSASSRSDHFVLQLDLEAACRGCIKFVKLIILIVSSNKTFGSAVEGDSEER